MIDESRDVTGVGGVDIKRFVQLVYISAPTLFGDEAMIAYYDDCGRISARGLTLVYRRWPQR